MVTKAHREILNVVQAISDADKISNVLLHGDSGNGKSDMVNQFAASHKRPLAVLEIGQLAESRQIFGYMDLKEGQTVYVPGLFTQAIQTPNCVVHLQELNRPESDKALNAIFSVLDDTFRRVWIDELGRHIQVAPGVTFFATLNEGFEFVGTMPLDIALRNRFQFKLRVGELPIDIIRNVILGKGLLTFAQVATLLNLIEKLRGNTQSPLRVSTRDIINIAELVGYGLAPMISIMTVLGDDNDQLESILLGDHLGGSLEVMADSEFVVL